MYEEYKWIFPNGCIKNKGINNGNIETFKDTPISSLGREICQNSGDARNNENEPVEVDFHCFEINTRDIPDVDNLRYAIQRGAEFWKPQDNPKADVFYENAQNIINAEKISILRISDHNTKGLSGADEPDNTKAPWTALVMSDGASSKDGTEGGSFGIGKFASFANSRIRTVFYSTYDCLGEQASQGLSILASFIDSEGSKTFGEGYCGDLSEKNPKPFFYQIMLDPEYSRNEGDYGTDIYILGFQASEGWVNKMVAAVIDGFFYAIDKNMLKVHVDGIEISKETLDDVVSKFQDSIKPETKAYHQVLRSDSEWIDFDDYDGNKNSMHLKLLVAPELNKRVAMVRKTGMKILDRKGINGQIPFAGILYIDGEESNKYLTSLENPAHIDWLVERDSDEKHAQSYITHMNRVIREELEKLIDEKFGGEINLQLNNMLQSIEKGDGDPVEQDVLTDEASEVKPRRREPSDNDVPPMSEIKNQDGDSFSSGEDESEQAETEGGRDGEGEEGDGTEGYGTGTGGVGNQSGDSTSGTDKKGEVKTESVELKLLSRRLKPIDVNKGRYQYIIRPVRSSNNAIIELSISAEDTSYKPVFEYIKVENQDNVIVVENVLKNVKLDETQKTYISFKVADSNDYTAFEVKCYEIKTK